MARRGISRAASLIDGFNAMYDTIGRVQRDQELRRVATAVPTMDEGFTPEQGAQLQAAANSGQYDFEWDPQAKGYKVRAKSDPNAVGTIAQGQRQSFLGQVQDKPLDEAGISRARQMAMAGVLERHGDLEGAGRLRDRLAADEDRAFSRERTRKAAERDDIRWDRDQKAHEAEQEFKEGLKALTEGSIFAQRAKAFQGQQAQFEAEKKAYDAKVEAGDASAIAPTPPQQPTMSSAERLLDLATAVDYLRRHGKATPEQLDKVAQQFVALNDEGYVTFLRMAAAGATKEQLEQAYNNTGKSRMQPGSIVDVKMVKRPGNAPAAVVTLKLPDGRTEPIDTFAEMTRMGKVEELMKAGQQQHQQGIQERQVAVSEGNLRVNQADANRRAAEFNAGAPEREARAAVAKLRTELAATTDPARQQEIESKIRALATGSRDGGGGAGGADPAKVKEARQLVADGVAPDMATAHEALSGRGERLFDKHFSEALKTRDEDQAMAVARRRMQASGYVERGGFWIKAPARSFATVAEVEAAAAKGEVKPGDRVTVGGRAATWK